MLLTTGLPKGLLRGLLRLTRVRREIFTPRRGPGRERARPQPEALRDPSVGDLAEQMVGGGIGVVAVEVLRERLVELGAIQHA
ncbi:hypothetical protein GCM10010176_103860 [Nonomuraea spiralis]|nr:hypothetical protein GCM10010176_103860 [Nonomuraea spiralis]